MNLVLPISVVIPTYRREQVLVDTLAYLLALDPAPAEIIVVDQTEQHESNTDQQLQGMQEQHRIRWLRLDAPSIPKAMNRGLIEASEPMVLFLDDDIRPEPNLIAAHHAAQVAYPGTVVAGRVIQPWEEGMDVSPEGPFRFSGVRAAWIDEFIGANFSIERSVALALGGFDENFVRVAYRYEAEFAHRLRRSGHRVRFEPGACLHHLKAGGGTRTFGDYLTTWKPDHAVGAYYHALMTEVGIGRWREFLARPVRAVATRHHLRHPWWIPLTCFAEFCGMVWALRLARAGPRHIRPGVSQ